MCGSKPEAYTANGLQLQAHMHLLEAHLLLGNANDSATVIFCCTDVALNQRIKEYYAELLHQLVMAIGQVIDIAICVLLCVNLVV